MALVKIGSVASLPPGSVIEVEHNGENYAIGNADGTLFCLEGLCPHAGGPLGQGALNGEMLVCPWHGWEFDCRTGANDYDEDLKLQKFPVTLQDDSIFIDVP
jgi:nitrite reductase/ring-hydroxylating ferredoxin subunit